MLTAPPRDSDGCVLPHDHDEIGNDDGVIRRISELWITADKNGNRRISSMAYKASSGPNGGMSVDLVALITAGGLDPRVYVTTPRWVGSVIFTAGNLREAGFRVGYDPLEEQPPDQPANPYHGEVWGAFSKGQQKRLAEMARWFVALEGVSLTLG